MLEAKINNFLFKTPIFPESGSGKHFQASGMRAIDSPHKITPRESIFREKSKFFDFASINTPFFLESGSGKRFHASRCAQSMFLA
jgi:hypothetical protein